jgi:hypothetical protein
MSKKMNHSGVKYGSSWGFMFVKCDHVGSTGFWKHELMIVVIGVRVAIVGWVGWVVRCSVHVHMSDRCFYAVCQLS